ncbi:MAG: hypothetical protein ACF8PN_10765 [Phycisphaerales bacterium]
MAPWIRPLFGFAAAYDLILGLGFLVAGPAIFNAFNITPPNHWGYIYFSAGVVLIFGVAFAMVALDPRRYRDFIWLGVLFKLVYSGVSLGYFFFGDIPAPWVWFGWFDLVFAGLFVAAAAQLRPSGSTLAASA